MNEPDVSKRSAGSGSKNAPQAVRIERLEERIALSLVTPKKAPEAPPYPPGTRYSLARRDTAREDSRGEQDEEGRPDRPQIERLEERVALSLVTPKKAPEPPPYPPGTLYGLARRENIPTAEESEPAEESPPIEMEQLEERVALSLIVPKKAPEPPPYPPGADYSLAKRENLSW
jgi:hypothetical protein